MALKRFGAIVGGASANSRLTGINVNLPYRATGARGTFGKLGDSLDKGIYKSTQWDRSPVLQGGKKAYSAGMNLAGRTKRRLTSWDRSPVLQSGKAAYGMSANLAGQAKQGLTRLGNSAYNTGLVTAGRGRIASAELARSAREGAEKIGQRIGNARQGLTNYDNSPILNAFKNIRAKQKADKLQKYKNMKAGLQNTKFKTNQAKVNNMFDQQQADLAYYAPKRRRGQQIGGFDYDSNPFNFNSYLNLAEFSQPRLSLGCF